MLLLFSVLHFCVGSTTREVPSVSDKITEEVSVPYLVYTANITCTKIHVIAY